MTESDPGGVGHPDEARLRELATEHALMLHFDGITCSPDGGGHRDGDRGPTAEPENWGFEACPHPDCVLVRQPVPPPGAVTAAPQNAELPATVIAWLTDNHVKAKGTLGHTEPFETCPYVTCEAVRVAAAAVPATQDARPTAFDFLAHLQRQREWSERTFGPGARAMGVIDHIRKELREIEADPTDVKEWIDVVILGLDGAWRAGYTPQQITDALAAKQAKNEARQWPDWRTRSADEAIEHDRSLDVPASHPSRQEPPHDRRGLDDVADLVVRDSGLSARDADEIPSTEVADAHPEEPQDVQALIARMTDYLGNGGFFNPELMEHEKVRDLILDARNALVGVRAALPDAGGRA